MENIQLQAEAVGSIEEERQMSCPLKPTTREQWIDYLDGALDENERVHLDLHAADCARCSEMRDRLLASREGLLDAAQRTNPTLSVSEGSLSRIWDGVRFRIRRALAPAEPVAPTLGLDQLRSILVSICGSATAEDALKTAALRTGEQEWEPFASNLSSIVEAMSGDRAARLVKHAARLVGRARVA